MPETGSNMNNRVTLNSAWYWLIWETCVTLRLPAFVLHQVCLFMAQWCTATEKFHGYPNPDLNPKETSGCAVSRAAEAWRRGHTARSRGFPDCVQRVSLSFSPLHVFIYFHCDTLSLYASAGWAVYSRGSWMQRDEPRTLCSHNVLLMSRKKCLESKQELSEQTETNKSVFFFKHSDANCRIHRSH